MDLCMDGQVLDRIYTLAWMAGNHAEVIEYGRKIAEHKASCRHCQGMALVDDLWPGVQVTNEQISQPKD